MDVDVIVVDVDKIVMDVDVDEVEPSIKYR